MNEQAFAKLAMESAQAGFNRIPVVHEVLADFDTPLSAYVKLAKGPYSYLLESAGQGGEKWGRYSIIGMPCSTIVKVTGSLLQVEENGQVVEEITTENPLTFIEEFKARYRVPEYPDLPRFFGGLVGYFSYDTIRFVETRLKDSTPADPVGTPDIVLMVSNDVIIYDNVSSRMQLVTLVDPNTPDAYTKAQSKLTSLAKKLLEPGDISPPSKQSNQLKETDFKSEFGKTNYLDAVKKIKTYIHEGDVMQVVLSQRLSRPFTTPPIHLYRALRSLNPSPYMYYMDLKDFHIVSSSPEILARVENGQIVNRPLAGTRRRGETEEEDRLLEKELLDDPKEIAEHLMLIDLGRNDVGRVAKTGSVTVTEQFVIERYSHVMHISSNVTGELSEGKTALDVLRATLPVGTLSGAPKIRAMEIIDELEPSKRGIYGGAVGYLAWNNNMDTAIAIRTAVVKDEILYIQAGGGVVADSIPELEWQESMNKGKAIFTAARMAELQFEELIHNQ